MNRRNFLWLAGASPVIAAIAPAMVKALPALDPDVGRPKAPLLGISDFELEARKMGWIPQDEWITTCLE